MTGRPSWCDEQTWAKRCRHVVQEGSRRHVLSWSALQNWRGQTSSVTKCSEPFCEFNYWAYSHVLAMGIDPSKVVNTLAQSVRAAEDA